MSRSVSIVYALASLLFAQCVAFAQQNEQATPPQEWRISFSEDTADIQSSKETEVKFVTSTIKALRRDGIKKFAIRTREAAPKVNCPSIAIRLHNGEAELTTFNDLPHKRATAVISALIENGVRKVKFAQTKPHLDAVMP